LRFKWRGSENEEWIHLVLDGVQWRFSGSPFNSIPPYFLYIYFILFSILYILLPYTFFYFILHPVILHYFIFVLFCFALIYLTFFTCSSLNLPLLYLFLPFFIGIVRGVETNWVHSALQPRIGLLCQPRVIMMMEKLVEWWFGKGNRSTRRKPAPVPLSPPQTPHACPDANPGRRGGKPATNCLSYDTATISSLLNELNLFYFCFINFILLILFYFPSFPAPTYFPPLLVSLIHHFFVPPSPIGQPWVWSHFPVS
jgi:hypothetical protein